MPFMEYAGSYALYNYRLADPARGMEYSNLRLIRAFEHGLDPASDEAGFVLVHVEMVKHSGALVRGALACLDARRSSSSSSSSSSTTTDGTRTTPRQALNSGLDAVLSALRRINAAMETMWARSRPAAYTSFRTFIFGITAQSMFPRGVTYEGVVDDDDGANAPKSFRGESGANDSMVPLVDNLLAIPMPDTPLTEILRDFRRYRPSNHREFLQWVADRSEREGLKGWALGLDSNSGSGHGREDADEEQRELGESRRLWLRVLDQVREFRWRHWCFAREYIIKRTSHPTATGGSPIVTWLPNQLQAVLDEMARVYAAVGGDGDGDGGGGLGKECADIMDLVARQREMLRKEVRRFCEERGVEPTM